MSNPNVRVSKISKLPWKKIPKQVDSCEYLRNFSNELNMERREFSLFPSFLVPEDEAL